MQIDRSLAAAVLACAAAGVAGCGGGGNKGLDSPTATVKTYTSAVGAGDGKKACSALAPSEQQAALRAAKASGVRASSCESLFSQVRAHISPAQRKQFENAKVTKVSQSGSTATVSVASASSTPHLEKSGDRWLITSGIGF